MSKRKHSKRSRTKIHKRAASAGNKMSVYGMTVAIPQTLSLPAGAPFEGRERPTTMQIPTDVQELLKPLSELATNAWRLKTRMVDPETDEPREEARKLYRHVEGLFRALNDAGIEVIDKTGKPYDNGMPEKVIDFPQTPGLVKEEIIETIRPSIRWKEQPLQHGEIIVGIPVIKTPPEEAPEAAETAPVDALQAVADQGKGVPAGATESGGAPSHASGPPRSLRIRSWRLVST